MDAIINKIRQELKANSDEKTRESGRRFFKEKIKLHGVKTAAVKKIGKEYFREIKDGNKQYIFDLCDSLWQSGFVEESVIACNWSYYIHKDYEPADFKVFEKWVNTFVSNWASCDTLCNHTVGAFVEKFPEFTGDLKKWAASDNRWVRRASAVTLIIPARHGKFLNDIFEIADILLMDKDDLVQKGYGWMLKAASHAHVQSVFDYVMKRKNTMPRTSLRYAIEKMPADMKKKAMGKKA